MHPLYQEDLPNHSQSLNSNNLQQQFSSLSISPSKNDYSSSWSPFSYTTTNNNNNNQNHTLQSQQNTDTLASPSLSKSSSEIIPTDTEIQRRALAATGLNVSAPEFIPSFVSTPTSSQPQSNITSPYQNQSSNHFNTFNPYSLDHFQTSQSYIPQNDEHAVYSNVTHLVSFENDFQSFLHDDFTNPIEAASLEDAVNHFDAQFPALKPINSPNQSNNSSVQSLFPQALGWDALRREQEIKRRTQQRLAQDEEKRRVLETSINSTTNSFDETPITQDIGEIWVQTGKSVANLYEELRSEAAQEASLRNKYFDRAAAAFRRNDGAAAKKLGAQGREANERMKALHRRAADAIFAARNPSHVTNVVDLHGLHVSEAIERLPQAIEKATADKIRILTGTGHHTKGTGRARLRPAVKKWLHENHYFFEEVIDANEHVGSFIVELKK